VLIESAGSGVARGWAVVADTAVPAGADAPDAGAVVSGAVIDTGGGVEGGVAAGGVVGILDGDGEDVGGAVVGDGDGCGGGAARSACS
jgi:hypothetical protein